MLTSKKLAKRARQSYLKTILPEMRREARRIAAVGLAELASDVVLKGHTKDSVRVDFPKFPGHTRKFFELVRRHVPVDIEIMQGAGFAVGKLYGSNTGHKEYRYPTWTLRTLHHCCNPRIWHNLEFLRKKKIGSLKIEAFTIVLEFFGCAKSGHCPDFWSDRADHFLERPDIKGLEGTLLEILLSWSQKHPESLIKLHRQDEHVAFYIQMPILDSRDRNYNQEKQRLECLALLEWLL